LNARTRHDAIRLHCSTTRASGAQKTIYGWFRSDGSDNGQIDRRRSCSISGESASGPSPPPPPSKVIGRRRVELWHHKRTTTAATITMGRRLASYLCGCSGGHKWDDWPSLLYIIYAFAASPQTSLFRCLYMQYYMPSIAYALLCSVCRSRHNPWPQHEYMTVHDIRGCFIGAIKRVLSIDRCSNRKKIRRECQSVRKKNIRTWWLKCLMDYGIHNIRRDTVKYLKKK